MTDPDEQIPLTGGNMNAVVRVGDEVRRPTGPWTPNVHALLDALESAGIDHVPRVIGVTEDGHERLSFVAGDVGHYPLPSWLWREEILQDAGRLLRRIHDATGDLAERRTGWQLPAREPVEVICHNDFAPYNFVFDRERLVGVIDFDTASPGPRLWDLAYLAYRLIPYVEDADAPAEILAAESRRRELLMAAYGSSASAEELWRMMADRLDALAAHSRVHASDRPELAGHAAMYDRDAARLRARARTSSAVQHGG
ncbi:aminoglycoside phosphotransferase family protein [Microbacterium sp. M28]|uniref:aminoglycoside phosphotransferase family protein n=1 Tax=Microbacterium sp. M28 TaxID=2962064 RepID=UPI0021F40EC7|nr:aminoglycoside phosphotransferase family protein [Microbacterium sp. M28]UYO96162.1 aminoglycoside phosphotransferase family protein [Microbacterium sp. M28]